MFAWLLHESPGTYSWGEVETPEPPPGHVRIKVVASALNHIDLWLTSGRPRPPAFPHIPGSDCAGIIDAIGAEVEGWNIGDEVVMTPTVTTYEAIVKRGIDSVVEPGMKLLGEHCWGGHAEYVVVPAWHPVPKPANRTWTDCAAYPVCYLTAWRMFRKARVQSGESVLVIGISGGVSTAALVVGRYLGLDVHVTSRDDAKLALALGLGATSVFNSAEGRSPVKVDVVIDSVGAATWDMAIGALNNGGRLVTCGGTSGVEVPLQLPRLFFKHLEVIGVTTGSQEEFVQITDLVADGLPVTVDGIYPLSKYEDALDHLRRSDQLGKVVLDHTLD